MRTIFVHHAPARLRDRARYAGKGRWQTVAAVLGLLVVSFTMQVKLQIDSDDSYPELASKRPKITATCTMSTQHSLGVAEQYLLTARGTRQNADEIAALEMQTTEPPTESVGAVTVSLQIGANDIDQPRERLAAPTRSSIGGDSSRRGALLHHRRDHLVHHAPARFRERARYNGKGRWQTVAAVLGLLVVSFTMQVKLQIDSDDSYPELAALLSR